MHQAMLHATGPAGDPYWANVVSMTNMPGSDGSTTLVDATGRSWTANGNVQIDTGVMSPVGTPSSLFDGTGDYWNTADSNDFFFGTGDFTLEFWAYPTGSAAGFPCLYGQQNNTGSPDVFQFRRDNANKLQTAIVNAGAAVVTLTSVAAMSTSNWYFCSICRVGNLWYQHLNGNMDGTNGNVMSCPNTAADVQAGAVNVVGLGLTGLWIGNIGPWRITKGVARYGAGNYTPPTTPFPDF